MQNNHFTLNGSSQEKLGYHNGIFTASYHEARAIYDAKIRNWNIEYLDGLFHVQDSKAVTSQVYWDGRIQNCGCSEFIECQSGTCLHIEAVKLLKISNKELKSARPIVFLNDEFKLKQIGNQEKPFFTPSVRPFLQMLRRQNLGIDDRKLSDQDLLPFQDQGIDLYDFQKQSVRSMIHNKRTILVLRMGLGKTICALTCCKILDKKKIIIIAPNSLKFQWQHEINRFQLGTSLVISKGSDFLDYSDQKFLILSYEMLNHHPEILKQQFDIAVADEIQKIKNPESVSWANLSKLQTEYVFALSGTPIQNNLSDLLALITFLNPYEIKPEWKFYQEYCRFSRAKIWGIKPDKVLDLRNRFKRYIVNPDIDYTTFKLPKKNNIIVDVELTSEQSNLHGGYLESARPLIAKSINYPLTFGEKNRLNSLLTLARMAITDPRLLQPQASPGKRLLRIQQHLSEIIGRGEKVVVYSEWIKALQLLYPFLMEQKIPFVCFNGSLSAKARDKQLQSFIEDPKIKVFLSTDSGGVGIDGLQFVCWNVIHLEKLWNPSKLDQRNGRLVRALQKHSEVNIYEYHSGSEIELMIDEAASRKYAIIADMLK